MDGVLIIFFLVTSGASCFLTITPNDVSNPTSFRLCHRSVGNDKFPATCPAKFLDALVGDQSEWKQSAMEGGVEIPIPLDYPLKFVLHQGIQWQLHWSTKP